MEVNTETPFTPPAPQSDLFFPDVSSTRAIGKMGSSIYNVGLALMRLEHVGKWGPETTSGLGIRGFVPDWWPRPTTPSA